MNRDRSIQSEWRWNSTEQRTELVRVTVAGRVIPLDRVMIGDDGMLRIVEVVEHEEGDEQMELEL